MTDEVVAAADDAVIEPIVEAPVVTPASDEPKSVLEAVTAGIEDGQNPRRIIPKAEEIAAGDTRPRNLDGTFKAESDEEKTARERAELIAKETPEEKTAREKAETEAAKKVDHVNDPIDPAVKGRTAERMKYLIDTVKQQAQIMESHQNLFGEIQNTGATPQEFGAMVAYMKAVHTTDPVQLENAYKILQGELKGLAVKLGKPIYEVNLLRDASNADLVKEIQEGKLTNARGHEIALQREQQRSTAATRTAATTSSQQQADDKAATAAGTAALNKLGGELVAKDGPEVYGAKYDILLPMLKPLFSRLNPSEWKQTFLDHYNNLAAPAKAAAAVTPTIVPKVQPQRPKQPAGAGGSSSAPKSALEAINAALEG